MPADNRSERRREVVETGYPGKYFDSFNKIYQRNGSRFDIQFSNNQLPFEIGRQGWGSHIQTQSLEYAVWAFDIASQVGDLIGAPGEHTATGRELKAIFEGISRKLKPGAYNYLCETGAARRMVLNDNMPRAAKEHCCKMLGYNTDILDGSGEDIVNYVYDATNRMVTAYQNGAKIDWKERAARNTKMFEESRKNRCETNQENQGGYRPRNQLEKKLYEAVGNLPAISEEVYERYRGGNIKEGREGIELFDRCIRMLCMSELIRLSEDQNVLAKQDDANYKLAQELVNQWNIEENRKSKGRTYRNYNLGMEIRSAMERIYMQYQLDTTKENGNQAKVENYLGNYSSKNLESNLGIRFNCGLVLTDTTRNYLVDHDTAKSGFKTVSKKYHPDLNNDKQEWATEMSKRINGDYEIFMNTSKSVMNCPATKLESKERWRG